MLTLDGTARPGIAFHRIDAVAALSWYLVLLIGIPSRLVFAPLGGAGTPAEILGLLALVWWTWFQVSRTRPTGNPFPPVRTAMWIVCACALVSYVVAATRPIDGTELSTADLSMVMLAGWLGILLLTHDGIPSIARWFALARRLVLAGGAVATLGLVQFVTKEQYVDKVAIPGLSSNHALIALNSREGFTRPNGTAIHPIEFGAVLTSILPFAIALAMTDHTRPAVRRWFPVAVIATVCMLSISRSAIVAAVVAFLVLLPTWERRVRLTALGCVGALLVFTFLFVPGMLGTITGLFTGIGNDGSARSRTDSYGLALQFIERNPLFGRGFGTFLPSYRIFDNQYLGAMVELGLVGLTAILGLLVAGIVVARRSRALSHDPAIRASAQAVVASIAASGVSLALYDGFGFPMAAGVLFLVIGMSGALWRLVSTEARPVTQARLVAVSAGQVEQEPHAPTMQRA